MDSITGHANVLNQQRPISEVLASPGTPEDLKISLRELQQARRYATTHLLLPDNDSYTEYADLKRPYVVWNVIAAPEYSVHAKQWCFLVVGCLSYRGYFNKQDALDEARQLKQQGYDVYVGGVRAYSTLGWFDDPLLNTMIMDDLSISIAMIFHELAHQKLYIGNDVTFNENFASFVEQQGVTEWYEYRKDKNAIYRYRDDLNKRRAFNTLLLTTRNRLDKLYKSEITNTAKQQGKVQLFKQLNADYAKLKQRWNGDDRYDRWMSQPLNNAHLALVSTYNDYSMGFQQLFSACASSWSCFYNKAEQLSQAEAEERKKVLTTPVTQ